MIKILSNSFVKKTMVVASGMVGVQLIGIAALPLLTRIYSPDQFGSLGYFISLSSVLTPFVGLGLYQALVVADDKDKIKVLDTAIKYIIFLSTLCGLILHLYSLMDLGENHYSNMFLFSLPVYVAFSALTLLYQQLHFINDNFKMVSSILVLSSLGVTLSKVAFGYLIPTGDMLVLSVTVGALLSSIALYVKAGDLVSNYKTSFQDKNEKVLKKYFKFPLYTMPYLVLNAMSIGFPTILLANFYSLSAAGYYALAKSVLGLPTNLIANSVASVLFPSLSKQFKNSDSSVYFIVRKGTIALLIIGLPIFGSVFLVGEELFQLVFGPDWANAGVFAAWLCLGWYMNFSSKACVSVIPVIGMQRFHLFYTAANLSIRFLGLYLCALYAFSEQDAVKVYSLSGLVLNGLVILFVINKLRKFK